MQSKGSRKNNFPCFGLDPSRLAALLVLSVGGLLNISLSWQVHAQEETAIISWRECSKKSVQQGRSHFDARSVHGVREHGKMARTPLAAFFNIPIRGVCAVLASCQTGVSAPKQGK